MLHPAIKLRRSKIQGKGLIAVKKIPKGTILWRLSNKDRIYSLQKYRKFSAKYRKLLNKYCYADGPNLIYCTDDAKYLNHSCDPNGSGLETVVMDIAIKDILKGEEVAYDYALLMVDGERMRCSCGMKNCRKIIKKASKNSALYKRLKKQAKNPVKYLGKVNQPLLVAEDLCPCGSGKKWQKCHGS